MPFKKGNKEAQKKGKHEKTRQWEVLAQAIVTQHAQRFNEILDGLDDDKKFLDTYLQILEYFKPKQARTEVKEESEQNITVKVIRE